ncbi:MAG: hypothetical protein DME26_08945 [Verrucomicrobia bacterium]|nr:MAG: hypothetical protein DME26_08945 [Verrucomicrobiota bacterium]
MKNLIRFTLVTALVTVVIALVRQHRAPDGVQGNNASLGPEAGEQGPAAAEKTVPPPWQKTAPTSRSFQTSERPQQSAANADRHWSDAELKSQGQRIIRKTAALANRNMAPEPDATAAPDRSVARPPGTTGVPKGNTALPPATTALPDPQFMAKATAPLQPGESLVIGGWPMDNDRRGYALVTPTLTTDADGTQKIVMESRVFAIRADALETAGLKEIIVEGGQAERYGVTDPELMKVLLKRLSELEGVVALGAANLASVAGEEAQLHAEALAGRNVHIYLRPSLTADGTGYDLDFDFGTAQPKR